MEPIASQVRVRRWLARLGAAVGLAFCLGYLPYQVYGGTGIGRLQMLRRELTELQTRNQVVAAENERLRAEVHALRYDLGAIEQVARDELGLTRPGEIVFRLEGR